MRHSIRPLYWVASVALSSSSIMSLSAQGESVPRSFSTSPTRVNAPSRPLRVGVLGATGAVGQRFLEHLENHPWFEVTKLGASEKSAGKRYREAANWLVSPDIPAYLDGKMVVGCTPAEFGKDVDLVFSALVGGLCCRVLSCCVCAPFMPSATQNLIPSFPSRARAPSLHAFRTPLWRPQWSPHSVTRESPCFPMLETSV